MRLAQATSFWLRATMASLRATAMLGVVTNTQLNSWAACIAGVVANAPREEKRNA
jgi:hypothetical protein